MIDKANVGKWNFDGNASKISCIVKQRFKIIEAYFKDFSGEVIFKDENGQIIPQLELAISATSISTGHKLLDEFVKGRGFFDAGNHPVARFVSTAAYSDDGKQFVIEGSLELRGVIQQVTLAASFVHAESSDGVARATVEVFGMVSLADFGMKVGGWGVSDRIEIHGEIFATRQN